MQLGRNTSTIGVSNLLALYPDPHDEQGKLQNLNDLPIWKVDPDNRDIGALLRYMRSPLLALARLIRVRGRRQQGSTAINIGSGSACRSGVILHCAESAEEAACVPWAEQSLGQSSKVPLSPYIY